ncbi:MAG: DUF99 family protein [Candidatus Micrarchaeia archaeon]
MKQGVRMLALDDSMFARGDKSALVMGMLGRRGEVEGAISFRVQVDGTDATEKIIKAVSKSRFRNEIKIVVLHSVLFAGLNMVDMTELRNRLGVESMAITRKRPSKEALLKAFKAAGTTKIEWHKKVLDRMEAQTNMFCAAGFYAQCTKGIAKAEAVRLLPEAVKLLRLAHIAASAASRGESNGRL